MKVDVTIHFEGEPEEIGRAIEKVKEAFAVDHQHRELLARHVAEMQTSGDPFNFDEARRRHEEEFGKKKGAGDTATAEEMAEIDDEDEAAEDPEMTGISEAARAAVEPAPRPP